MPFSISFCDTPLVHEYDDPLTPGAEGILLLGDWKESFLSSLYTWSKSDYERQWQHAITSLIDGDEKSALITEYISPEASSHLVWWPLYREGGSIYVHNQILFYDQLSKPFSLEEIAQFVAERQTVDGDGNLISEWNVTLEALIQFAAGFAGTR